MLIAFLSPQLNSLLLYRFEGKKLTFGYYTYQIKNKNYFSMTSNQYEFSQGDISSERFIIHTTRIISKIQLYIEKFQS